jgi:Predicted glycosyltransferases
MEATIPIVLFAYARPEHLKRTLECLRENQVPLIYAFSDGPKTPQAERHVREVRDVLNQVDWCDIHIVSSEKNLGLGKSILAGVSDIFRKHDALIVFEDDLICVPGTYQYLVAALEHYKDNPMVMSVTGWTHPLVTPGTVINQPYFDGRAECWSWGSWARAWKGMDQDAMSLVKACRQRNIDIYRYGADLPEMAKEEEERNIWAVRFLYLHILHGGLCLRPPQSMVDHAGFDENGTNANEPSKLSFKSLDYVPLLPEEWPVPVENPECQILWRREYGGKPTLVKILKRKLLRQIQLRKIKIPKAIKSLFQTLTKV